MKKYFVTGTDTNVGKTLITAALLIKAKEQGLTTMAMKPIAAGCDDIGEGLQNDDALLLQKYISLPANKKISYQQVNPVALRQAIAPHIAAQNEKRNITINQLEGLARGVFSINAQVTFIEGAGGWRVPINTRETLADLPKRLQVPVILVVDMRLGCLNHTLLTAEAIRRDGLTLAGWVANNTSANTMEAYQENKATLQNLLPAEFLGEVPYCVNATPEALASFLKLPEH